MRLLPLTFLAIAIVPSAALAETRAYFRDWLAACRDDGYCSAITYINPNPGDGRVADYWFRIGRHAEGLYWELSFTPIRVMADPEASFELRVDDMPFTFSGVAEIAAFGSVNDFYLLGSKAQGALDRMMPAASMSMTFQTVAGPQETAEFSLSGLTAALVWIDEQQGRLGSERVAQADPEGLVRVRPATGVLSTGEVDMDAVPRDLVALDESRPDKCDGFDIVGSLDFYRYPLADDKVLWLLPCTAGAYNRFYSVYLQTGGGYDLLLFATPTYSVGWQAEEGVWLESFDPETGMLRSANLGRGIGDCGMKGLWRWTGSRFAMLEYRMQTECDATVAPGEFPLVFRNDEAPNALGQLSR